MIMLETLKSDNPGIHRMGETWMRCSLKSYIRYAKITQEKLVSMTDDQNPRPTYV